ncbi:MAG: hypothetical protein R3E79_44530 [Caldilineaceae bacterium]
MNTVTLTGQEITLIEIKSGGYDGVLVEICINAEPLGCVNFEALALGMSSQINYV